MHVGRALHRITFQVEGLAVHASIPILPRLHSELVQSQAKMAALESQLTALQKEKNESITSLEKQRNTLLRKYKKAKSEIERLRVDLERAKVGLHTYMDKPSPVPCLMPPRCVSLCCLQETHCAYVHTVEPLYKGHSE